MAYFTSSALVAGQSLFNDNIKNKGEWRLPDVAALDVANMGQIANPNLAELRTREDRSVYAYMPIRQAATNGTARAHAHTGAPGDSAATTLSWTTYSEPFSISLKQADNNVMSWANMYASNLRNAVLNMLNRIDAWFVAAALADKTGYSAGGGLGTFDTTPDVYQVPVGEADYFFQNVKQCLNFNLYRGEIIGILDSVAKVRWDRLQAFGAQNAENRLAVNSDGMRCVGSTRSVLGSSYSGSGLFFENGLVAVIPWIPRQNRKALDPEKAFQYNGDYGQIMIPEIGVPFAIHEYAARADNSSYGGYTQDLTLYGEVSLDIGYCSSPLSSFRNAADTVIYAAGQLPS